jgi:hypothetical protein
VLGGEVYGSTSEPSSGRYCIDYITSIDGGVFGESWDGITLQEVLDAEYGVGVINAAEDYEGFHPGDADPAYWEDIGVNSILVREIAGFQNANLFGWYEEDLAGIPVLDGVGDGVIFDGPTEEGAEMYLEFPGGVTRFGFFLNPNGLYSTTNAPEPEAFFTNRYYNDIGPDGSGAVHPPLDGDLQCLIYDISHLRGGLPTYVLAWEDLDSGAALSAEVNHLYTDNDYNDLVIEVSAFSPVKLQPVSWGTIKAAFGED